MIENLNCHQGMSTLTSVFYWQRDRDVALLKKSVFVWASDIYEAANRREVTGVSWVTVSEDGGESDV